MDSRNRQSTRLHQVAASLALLLSASVASAQGPWSSSPEPSSAYTSEPIQQYPPPSSAKQQAMHRGYQGAFHIGVPIFLNVDRNVVRPGADLYIFGGYDIGYLVFGISAGAMWTPINFYNIPGIDPGYDRSPMTRLYFSPELRIQVPNNTPILPHLGITFDANWWRVKETNIVCGGVYYWYCARVAVFRFTPGMTATLGFGFDVSGGMGTHIDVGVKYSLSGTGSFFFRREQWITPYIGMLFR